MNITTGAKTDPGQRPNNEDQMLVLDPRRHHLHADSVLVIADGMGGRNAGERASAVAVETVQKTLTEMLDAERTETVDISDALASALRKANARVYDMAHASQDNQGMGTTCVAAVIAGNKLYVAHAGDSRAYLLRAEQLERLTDDHSFVAEQVRAGVLTEESARNSRFRNVITRAVGIEPTITPDVSGYDLQPGDVLLLCTDGLSNVISEEEMAQTLLYAPSAQSAADKLVQSANRAGGRDNITAVVARLDVEDAADGTPAPAKIGKPERSKTPVPSPARNGKANVGLLILSLLLAVVVGDLAWVLGRDGYRFHPAPPFLGKPAPPPAPKPPDLAHLSYAAPVIFYVKPVQSDLLAYSPADQSLTTVTLSGQLVRLASSGNVLYTYPLPASDTPPKVPGPGNDSKDAQNPATSGAPGVSHSVEGLQVAIDPQGNLYLSDPVAHSITKYRPNGDLIGIVARTTLVHPGALAVTADGTVYVVDAERLKVIRVNPSK